MKDCRKFRDQQTTELSSFFAMPKAWLFPSSLNNRVDNALIICTQKLSLLSLKTKQYSLSNILQKTCVEHRQYPIRYYSPDTERKICGQS